MEKLPGLPESRYKPSTVAKGQGLGGKALEGLNKQGARFIRGLETYLSSLESRTKSSSWAGKPVDEVKALKAKESEKWEGVVDKVEEKFGKLVNDVQGEIHTWYKGIREREGEIVSFYLSFLFVSFSFPLLSGYSSLLLLLRRETDNGRL